MNAENTMQWSDYPADLSITQEYSEAEVPRTGIR